MSVLSPTLNLQVGSVKALPLIVDEGVVVSQMVGENVRVSKEDWDSFETSWDFKKHPMI